MKLYEFAKWWIYHTNRGIIAGPFKTKESAQKRVDAMIHESYGQSLWLEIVASGRLGCLPRRTR
jgi:hypothetical protein